MTTKRVVLVGRSTTARAAPHAVIVPYFPLPLQTFTYFLQAHAGNILDSCLSGRHERRAHLPLHPSPCGLRLCRPLPRSFLSTKAQHG